MSKFMTVELKSLPGEELDIMLDGVITRRLEELVQTHGFLPSYGDHFHVPAIDRDCVVYKRHITDTLIHFEIIFAEELPGHVSWSEHPNYSKEQCMNCDAPLTEDHWKVCPSNPDNYHECNYTIFNSQTRVDDEGKYIQVMECECGNVKNFEMNLYS